MVIQHFPTRYQKTDSTGMIFLFMYRGIWRGSVQSQIFVRKNNQVIAVSIDLFTSGKNLVQILTDKLGEDAKKYILLYGTKKVANKH